MMLQEKTFINCSKLADINAVLKGLDKAKPLTVVFVDKNYLLVFRNWHEYAARFLLDNLVVVCLDKETYSTLQNEKPKFELYSMPWDGSMDSLWKLRINFLAVCVASGFIVIHSDADAVWKENPLPYLEHIDADLIFSQGTVWPMSVYSKLGIVLCCGFFMIRANERSIHLLNTWYQRLLTDGDDQRSLNELLLENGLQWPGKPDYIKTYQKNIVSCYKYPQIASLPSGLSIGLLPHRLFQRMKEDESGLVVHLLSLKTGSSCEDTLRENGLWII